VSPYVKAACFLKLLPGAKLPQRSAKLPEQRPFCFLLFFLVTNKKTQRRERKKEENSSFFILLLPFFFFFFYSSFDFFPLFLAHVFVHACWFILTLFMFCHHSCSIARA
jgi:hypothetical protein